MKKVRSKLRPTEIGVIKTFSLSPDDKIGEIAVECAGCTYYYNNLSELCEKWEDCEELKEYWYIDWNGEVCRSDIHDERTNQMKLIGNYFETKEEAELAVEKLKAWKRLNKCEFRFEGYNNRDRANGGDIVIYAHVDIPNNNLLEEAQPAMLEDLDILFGGEE